MALRTDKTDENVKTVDGATRRKRNGFIVFCAEHNKLYSAMRSVLGVVINAAIFGLGTNILSDYYKSRGVDFKALIWLALIIGGLIIALAVWFLDDKVNSAKQEVNREREKQESLKNCAIQYLANVDTTEQEYIINKSINSSSPLTYRALAEICYRNIQNSLSACYNSVLDYHNKYLTDEERFIDEFCLTVNFMTESYLYSYKDDEGVSHPSITIAAWRNFNCNKEPSGRNALGREPKIYAQTEAAKMYGEPKKEIKIISSTEQAQITMNKEDAHKMQSMVIAPVLSQNNKLIGTLVAHCNEENFFNENNKAFFNTILKIFTESIKKDKALLDALMLDKELRKELKTENSFAIF